MMRSEFNTPASAWGFNTPLDLSDELPYENVPHYCDWNCNTEVKHEGQVCDSCLVNNAECSGDWDDESIAAAERMGPTPNSQTAMTFNADAHGHLITQRAPSDDEQTPAQREQRADDRFDELWNDLKARMRGARGERDGFHTFGEDGMTVCYGARVRVFEPEEDEDGKLAVTIGVSMRTASLRFATHRDDLINIAAHCLGAVADMDELNNEQR